MNIWSELEELERKYNNNEICNKYVNKEDN